MNPQRKDVFDTDRWQLATLLDLAPDAERLWRDKELGAILRHQLTAPLQVDLINLERGLTVKVRNLAGIFGMVRGCATCMTRSSTASGRAVWHSLPVPRPEDDRPGYKGDTRMNAIRKHATALSLALGLVLCAHSQAMGEEKAPTAAAKPAESAMSKLFGQELRSAQGEKVAVEKLDGKLVGIYFSAHWCPPCRAFTPKLVEFHKAVTGAKKPFEIVFVSSDKDEAAMNAYMKETAMPWLAVPFGAPKVAELKKQFNVRGIPFLVVVNAKGETVSTMARNEVTASGAAAFDAWAK